MTQLESANSSRFANPLATASNDDPGSGDLDKRTICSACAGRGFIVEPNKSEPASPSSAHSTTIEEESPTQGDGSITSTPISACINPDERAAAMAAVYPPLPPDIVSANWYVVTVGARVGVFINWMAASCFVHKVPGGTYTLHSTRVEAEKTFNIARSFGAVKVVLPNGTVVPI